MKMQFPLELKDSDIVDARGFAMAEGCTLTHQLQAIVDAANRGVQGESFHALANMACEELPEGWRIEIELEKDAGNVLLIDEWGEEVEFSSNHERIDETLRDAVEFAKEWAK